MSKKLLTFVEVDLDYCSLRYGVGACPATITGPNPTGDHKCFNSLATCQVREAFQNAPVTLRFAKGTAYLAESGVDAIAAIESENFTPPTVSLGENLGTRASLSVTFSDFRWPDTGPGFDKYVSERAYNPFEQGTFWGKFRSRHPFLRGRAIRLIRGELGQSLEEMEVRHFIMESFEGPSLDGRFTIVAKDALKLADDDRAQAPKPSTGYLSADINAATTSINLLPVGIGNIEYPSSGKVNIGGKEICAFTRVGDVMTLTRAQHNTVAVAHKAQDRVQLCLEFIGKSAASILNTLFVDYAAMPSGYIPLADWEDEVGAYLGVLYGRLIAEPTGVSKLASELVQQAALSVWWDDLARLMRLRVLRSIPSDAALFYDENILGGSMRIKDQHEKRLSQVWVYYGQINPLTKGDEPANYRSLHVSGDLLAEADYGQPAVKKIYAGFIPEFGRQVARRAGDIVLGQFRNPPRLMSFRTFREIQPVPELGMGCNIMSRPLQTDTGAPDSVPAQITRITPQESGYLVEAPELRFFNEEIDTDDRTIIISSNTYGFNWRTSYDRLFPPPRPEDEIICIISAGAVVGSLSAAAAFVVGSWPSFANLKLVLRGTIQGRGGNGGRGGRGGNNYTSGDVGGVGGTAIYSRHPFTLDLQSGARIWSGGGGGGGGRGGIGGRWELGGGGGGGGAGTDPGTGASGGNGYLANGRAGSPGTSSAGGAGGASGGAEGNRLGAGRGGAGGGPGLNGSRGVSPGGGTGTAGGLAGFAIDGNSFATRIGTGDIRGRLTS